ncbi:hypothetical protein [Actinomycetospora chiangmaiensis]|uniref:hypothetical protein n=1 Tax=Actinomycetospora chiangmaiensis TaxID=402650 RepID=UPI00035F7A3C|nr:hypothetical protein [Actinomycetospora chiangmaiensis]
MLLLGDPPAGRAQEALLGAGVRPGRAVTAQVGIVAAVLAGAVFVVALRSGLDAKYSSDGTLIRQIATGQFAAGGDQSFRTVGALYRLLGLGNLPTLAGLLGFAAFALCVLPLVRADVARDLSWVTIGLAVATVGLGAVYLGDYSKDVWLLPVLALVLAVRGVVAREVVLAAGIVVYAGLFRQYWFLVYAFYLVLRLATLPGRRGRLPRAAVTVAAALTVTAVAFPLLAGTTISSFRSSINAGRTGMADAQSAIEPVIAGQGPVAEAGNALLTQVTLYVPLPLLAEGGAVYLAATAFLAVLWFAFFRAVATDPLPSTAPDSPWPVACLVLSFTAVQGIFEPDHGSALRHLTPVLLLVLSVLVLRDRAAARPTHRITPGGTR